MTVLEVFLASAWLAATKEQPEPLKAKQAFMSFGISWQILDASFVIKLNSLSFEERIKLHQKEEFICEVQN